MGHKSVLISRGDRSIGGNFSYAVVPVGRTEWFWVIDLNSMQLKGCQNLFDGYGFKHKFDFHVYRGYYLPAPLSGFHYFFFVGALNTSDFKLWPDTTKVELTTKK